MKKFFEIAIVRSFSVFYFIIFFFFFFKASLSPSIRSKISFHQLMFSFIVHENFILQFVGSYIDHGYSIKSASNMIGECKFYWKRFSTILFVLGSFLFLIRFFEKNHGPWKNCKKKKKKDNN